MLSLVDRLLPLVLLVVLASTAWIQSPQWVIAERVMTYPNVETRNSGSIVSTEHPERPKARLNNVVDWRWFDCCGLEKSRRYVPVVVRYIVAESDSGAPCCHHHY